MPSYLISWKPATENAERGWPIEKLAALVKRLERDGAASERWRFLRRNGVSPGERVFVVRQGKAGHAIIGYGEVAELPTRRDGYTKVSFAKLLNPEAGAVLATADELHAITTKKGVWDTMASGVTLPEGVAAKLEALVVNREPVPDDVDGAGPAGKWTREELKASVQAYREMQEALRAGKDIDKKAVYRALAARFGRTEKAYEYRMQNISYVLSLEGRGWIPGLVPARNVGANVAVEIESALAEVEVRPVNDGVEEQVRVQQIIGKGQLAKPAGIRKPAAVQSQATQYERDLKVKAWVLLEADGSCECCKEEAPFTTAAGLPFLEVHHLRKLADGGSDTVENAVALCPNCHRQLHYGRDANELLKKLYSRLARLVPE